MSDKDILKELRHIQKNKHDWKSNISKVAEKLDENNSVDVNAKALWLLGEMGLKYPVEIEKYVKDIICYLDNDNPKLRQRSTTAIGRIGRADKNLVIPHMDKLMILKNDKSGGVRHAFVWACENIAVNASELFCEKLDIFYTMIFDLEEKVRIEAPEIFRVISKSNPECVKPYLDKLEEICENDKHPVVRIHCAGAIRVTKKSLSKY